MKAQDRQIVALAAPALGALAAEPLYLLADTAIVGHLGTPQLAALALAGAVLAALVALCNFLAYGTTAQVARSHGARQTELAAQLGAQAVWLALFIGIALALATGAGAGAATRLLGGHGHVQSLASSYLRISALGLPFALVGLAGQGYLRGAGRLRIALWIVVAANALNVVLELWFVYGLGWGLAGSAWGTVLAQAAMALALVLALDRPLPRPQPRAMRGLARIGTEIAIRTAALLGSFVLASAVLARIGTPSLGAHQVAFQLFIFLALVLDALAIAAQVLIGRLLGAGEEAAAYDSARRVVVLSLLAGVLLGAILLALSGPLPRLFTDDPAVLDRIHAIWPLFALMQPAAAIVFALDGVLIGAGDTRYLAGSMVLAAFGAYVPLALAALHFGWGIVGVWCGLLALMAVRLLTNCARFAGRRWIVLGAPA